MDNKKLLVISDCNLFRSTNLMDQLRLQDEEGVYKNDYLLLKNAFKLWKNDDCYYVSLYYGRLVLGDIYVSDNFTFSKLKKQILGKELFEKNKGNFVITKYVYDALDSLLTKEDDCDELFFDVPICIDAQTDYDRPSFGETSLFAIYGVKFSLFFSMGLN